MNPYPIFSLVFLMMGISAMLATQQVPHENPEKGALFFLGCLVCSFLLAIMSPIVGLFI